MYEGTTGKIVDITGFESTISRSVAQRWLWSLSESLCLAHDDRIYYDPLCNAVGSKLPTGMQADGRDTWSWEEEKRGGGLWLKNNAKF